MWNINRAAENLLGLVKQPPYMVQDLVTQFRYLEPHLDVVFEPRDNQAQRK